MRVHNVRRWTIALALSGILAVTSCGKDDAATEGEPTPVEQHQYEAATLPAFEKLLTTPEWRRADPPLNPQGMLEAVHEKTGLTFVLVPTGTFQMGSPKTENGRDENEDLHPVTIRQPLLLSQTECTQAAWDRIGGYDEREWKGSTLPMEGVSWGDVKSWCGKAGLRLPSESEWEYACRAGSTSRWCFGDSEAGLEDYAWCRNNSGSKTHAAAGKRPNAWGLCDMHGNVWEWCEDWYGDYSEAPSDGTARTTQRDSPDRVFRGGSWNFSARLCRSAQRFWFPSGRLSRLGFRPAADLPE